LRKDSNVPQRERISEWVRLYRQSPLKYEMNALLSVLETDGEQMLSAVLKELGLTASVDLVKDAKK
jgi:hypothetical protein